MYCINCGNEINKEVKFCSGCGSENKLRESYINEKEPYVEKPKEDEYLYREPLMTSIVKGVTFIPNIIAKIFRTLGGGYGIADGVVVYLMTYLVCIILIFPIWIISAILVIIYRIFIMPKLIKDNII